MIKKNDIILIGAVIVLCIIILIAVNVTKTEGSKLKVIVNDKVIKVLDLYENTSITIEGENGEENTFEIIDGYANMLDANCPDKLCVLQRKINFNNETIVCLPNKVVLQVSGGDDSGIDSIAQ